MTVCDLLRAETRTHHARAEASLGVMDERLDRERYARTLAALHGLYAPLEARLAVHDWAALGLDWAPRRKTPLLERDLAALGVAPWRLARLARSPVLPDVSRLDVALGALYVLEGATLGGQLVRRHLARTLGVGESDGAAFYGAYGDQVGPMWRRCRAFLDAVAVRERCAPARIVAGACETFDAFAGWLAHAAPPAAAVA